VGYSQRILSSVVFYAHQHNVKVLISVGGWSGSKYFTEMTSTEENMDAFVESVRSTVFDLDLDGIDIDWEYPGREGNNNKYALNAIYILYDFYKIYIYIYITIYNFNFYYFVKL